MPVEQATPVMPTRKPSASQNAPVFIVGSARSGNTMLYSMLMSSGRFPAYRTEPCVFDLLVPRFGDLGNPGNRRELMRTWIHSKQFRVSDLSADLITEKVES